MLKIYNTESRKVEEFIPLNKDKVTMYVCGPTVYSDIHIGNARPVIFFDTLKSYLNYLNYNVYYVSNITDVDDKIIEEAKHKKIKEEDLTNKYTKRFIEATKYVGSNLPDLMPKATSFVSEMIDYILELINKGYAYETNSGVYFRTTKLDAYGSISNQKSSELEESVRIENKGDKEDFRDFSLWKKTNDGLSFNSPWGYGRPGWHTECAVMNHEIFKNKIDIHGGGTDLIFPHHENENIQCLAHSDHELSNYWMHVGRVDFNNDKMSKSLGNTVLVKDLKDPISYRMLVLAHHYRRPINFKEELLKEYEDIYFKMTNSLKRANLKIGINYDKTLIDLNILNQFEQEMNNDLNTANVISLILSEIRNINKTNDIITITKMFNSILKILDVLGLNPNINLTNEVLSNYNNWILARENKEFDIADKLRDKLSNEGWI